MNVESTVQYATPAPIRLDSAQVQADLAQSGSGASLISVDAIRAILMLGVRGDLAAPAAPAEAQSAPYILPSEKHRVDMFA